MTKLLLDGKRYKCQARFDLAAERHRLPFSCLVATVAIVVMIDWKLLRPTVARGLRNFSGGCGGSYARENRGSSAVNTYVLYGFFFTVKGQADPALPQHTLVHTAMGHTLRYRLGTLSK